MIDKKFYKKQIEAIRKVLKIRELLGSNELQAFNVLLENADKKDTLIFKNWRTHNQNFKIKIVYERLVVSKRSIQRFITNTYQNIIKDKNIDKLCVNGRHNYFNATEGKMKWTNGLINLADFGEKWFIEDENHQIGYTAIVDYDKY